MKLHRITQALSLGLIGTKPAKSRVLSGKPLRVYALVAQGLKPGAIYAASHRIGIRYPLFRI
jgi:hypothetical protein